MNLLPKRAQSLSTIPIREFMERIVEERDRQYDMRFRAAELAVQTALLAQKELTANIFAASEKSTLKAEEAQTNYNVAHNDLAHKMEAQYKEMMPRAESLRMHQLHDEKLITVEANLAAKIETMRLNLEKADTAINAQIVTLRESISALTGERVRSSTMWGYAIGIVSIAITVILGIAYILKP